MRHRGEERLLVAAVVLAVPMVALVGRVSGQPPEPEGAIVIRPGSVEPVTVRGRTAGALFAASELAAGCAGWVASDPSYTVDVRSAGPFWLRAFVESESDTVLVVRGPSGAWRCSDDRWGHHPALDGPWAPGSYEVWVGTYDRDERPAFEMTLTRSQTLAPGGAAIGEDHGLCGRSHEGRWHCLGIDAPANFACRAGDCSVRVEGEGARWSKRISAGGGIDPLDLSSLEVWDAATGQFCSQAFVTPTPDLRVHLDAERAVDADAADSPEAGDAERSGTGTGPHVLSLAVQTLDGSDATLLVRTPTGEWRCIDDGPEGSMPLIRFESPETGVYQVWVGSYAGQRGRPAVLHVEPVRSVGRGMNVQPRAGVGRTSN